MADPRNLILLITDGHGHHTGDDDWGTEEFRGLRSRLERLQLARRGYAKFNNVMSPAVSTIMTIESILAGIHAAKTHKLHWREWPEWDRLEHPVLSTFLQARGYEVNGFSYLLNAENWMPGILCYAPELYRDFPSHKRDTHSHRAVLAAVKHFFAHAFRPGRPQALIVHTIFLFDLWDELMALFARHGLADDNTVFAFTADHYFPRNFGRQWLLGERDAAPIYHHTDLTEHNTRVFLHLKYPGLQPREIDDVVAGYDLTPTLLELLGLRGEWPAKFDGESLVPLLEGRPAGERTLRADNLYPYQVGEKQGRIAAVRRGRYKYVWRPDPASSYIAYRLHEPWPRVAGHEELYDIPADPEEQANLVASADPAAQAALAGGRAEMRRTTDDVLAFHAVGVAAHAERTGLAGRLRAAVGAGERVVCVQAGPPEVSVTLVHVLATILPEAKIDVVGKALEGFALPAGCTAIPFPRDAPYSAVRLRAVLGARVPAGGYACALRLAGVTGAGFGPVYDERVQPLDDFAAAGTAIEALGANLRGSLALDGALTGIAPVGGPGLAMKARTAVRAAVARVEPALRRWAKKFKAEGGPRMPRHFSERLIRDERSE